MIRAVITGAAGFAGFSTTREMLNRGYEVYAVLRPGSAHNKRLDVLDGKLHLIELDCVDFDKISDYISEECDVFYHLAWFGGRDDFAVQMDNIDYCIKAIESAAKLKCKLFIGIGSQAEYGVVDGIMSENLLPNPFSAYGSAKVAAMYLSRRRAEQLGLDWIWGRIFSLYGDYEPSGRMFPDLIMKLKNNQDIRLSSCEQNWDYLHVRDAANAIIALGEKGHSGEIYNIANGDYKPLKEFVEAAKKHFSYEGNLTYGEKADPFISLSPDVSKIKKHTGWNPVIGFDEGVIELVDEENKYYDSLL